MLKKSLFLTVASLRNLIVTLQTLWNFCCQIRCDYNGESFKKIVDLQLDKQHGALYIAFPHCLVRAPLGNCERYSTCKK